MLTVCNSAQVWSLADNSRRGYLDVRGFSKVQALSPCLMSPHPLTTYAIESKHT